MYVPTAKLHIILKIHVGLVWGLRVSVSACVALWRSPAWNVGAFYIKTACLGWASKVKVLLWNSGSLYTTYGRGVLMTTVVFLIRDYK